MNPQQGEDQNGRLCQSTPPAKRNTTSNLLYISFDSDATVNGRGFKLRSFKFKRMFTMKTLRVVL